MAEIRQSSAPKAEAPTSRLLATAGPTMSVRDSARVMQVHPTTLYDMIRRGDLERLGIRSMRLGRAVRIVTADLRRAVGVESEGAA